MGRSITPKYKLEIRDGSGKVSTFPWSGRPTPQRLEDWVKSYAKSLEIGGSNEHISRNLGFIPYPTHARILLNRSAKVAVGGTYHETPVVQWVAPAFIVW